MIRVCKSIQLKPGLLILTSVRDWWVFQEQSKECIDTKAQKEKVEWFKEAYAHCGWGTAARWHAKLGYNKEDIVDAETQGL
jgi:hypothetical protein